MVYWPLLVSEALGISVQPWLPLTQWHHFRYTNKPELKVFKTFLSMTLNLPWLCRCNPSCFWLPTCTLSTARISFFTNTWQKPTQSHLSLYLHSHIQTQRPWPSYLYSWAGNGLLWMKTDHLRATVWNQCLCSRSLCITWLDILVYIPVVVSFFLLDCILCKYTHGFLTCLLISLFRDASFGNCTYNLTVLDCLQGIRKVRCTL